MAQIVLLGEAEQLVEAVYALLTVDRDYPNSRGHSRVHTAGDTLVS
jgi:hypothetical protein